MISPISKRIRTYSFRLSLVGAFILFWQAAEAQVTNPVKRDTVSGNIAVDTTQQANKAVDVVTAEANKSHWYQTIALKGYLQVRYNRLLETNPELKTPYDASVGDKGGFLIRRARLVFSGQVHERVFFYVQMDLGSTPAGSSTINFAQIRDAYADISLDHKNRFRLRVGQSKIPYGFENMQSSQNRLTLDRSDAINSGLPNERDLGLIFYWAPDHIRKQFSKLIKAGLKGCGDYGVFGLGIYNGQTVNKVEANNNLHVVARVSYPFAFKNGQVIEHGIQAYTGQYAVTSDQLSSNEVAGGNFDDCRIAASLFLYPQPFGFQTEYNIGKGPQFNPGNQSIAVKSLHGGYAQAMYLFRRQKQVFIPFAKIQYYKGGKKAETDARYSQTYETEIGVEWQPIPAFELTAQYTIADRLTQYYRNPNNRQYGNLLRLQAQINF